MEVTGRDNYQSLLDVALNSTISYRVNVTTLKQQITIQENELLATKVHVDNLTTQLDWQANELDRLQNELSHQAKSATVLAESLKKIEEEKALMFNSLSWKLTKPLRFTKRVALALSRRGTPKNMHLKNKLSRLNKVLNLKKNQLGGYTQLALWSYQRYRSYGYTGFISKLKRAMNPVPVSSNAVPVYEYEQWIEKHENIDSVKLTAFSSRLASFEHLPTISIVMPCYNAPVKYLCEAIESVRNQIYSRWELCIADDASTSEETVLKLKEYAALDPRIKITFRSKNGHISNASNSARLC